MGNLYNWEEDEKKRANTEKSAYQKNMNALAKKASEKWYAGNQPTSLEIKGQIGKIMKQDPKAGNQFINAFQRDQSNPSSPYYEPYRQPTTRFRYNGMTNNPVTNLREERQIANEQRRAEQKQALEEIFRKTEEDTQQAEREWSAAQDELIWKAKSPKRTKSDDELIASLNMEKYPMLKAMDDGKEAGNPVELNRPVGYSWDNETHLPARRS